MEANTTTLLPYVLDLLSRRPDLKCTVEELCEHMKDVVIEDVITPFGSLHRAVEFAIELGVNIGILKMKEDSYPVPFNLHPPTTDSDESFVPHSMRCKSALQKPRISAKAKAKSRKRRCAAPVLRVGAKKRPQQRPRAVRKVKKRCAAKRKTATTTTRRRRN